MRQRRSRIAAIRGLTVLGAPAAAAAQDVPAHELAGGYQLFVDGGAVRPFSGWSGSFAINATERWGLVFEYGRAASSHTYTRSDPVHPLEGERLVTVRTDEVPVRRTDTVVVRGLGVRYRVSTGKRSPFMQLLVSSTRTSWEETPAYRAQYTYVCRMTECGYQPSKPDSRPYSYWTSQYYLTLLPSLGVDVQVARRAVLRFRVEWLCGLNLSYGHYIQGAKFQAGMAYGFGSR